MDDSVFQNPFAGYRRWPAASIVWVVATVGGVLGTAMSLAILVFADQDPDIGICTGGRRTC